VRTENEVLAQFDSWARGNDLVRAAVLTSSRARPDGKIDFLSDYDIELYVGDLEPFQRDDGWLDAFGPIMARWPFRPRSTGNDGWITRLVLFRDGVRIDFQISDQLTIAPNEYDDGYKVLIDKDDLTTRLNPPTFSANWIKKPSQEQFDTLVHEFWWDATYVPKYLWRDELPFAASVLSQVVRTEYLHTVIEWFIGLQHGWSVNTGHRGKHFKRYLDGELWSEYAGTFAGAEIEENWQAFFNAVALFRKLAKIVGESLGYAYPMQMDKEMTEYFTHIRNHEFEVHKNQNF
jgi:aminoglycoside 6-adenylyltransferase